ncbi:cellulase family glycosylhydrolase [Alkalitalea saponilacus]|uniref:Por secretion system C-terminal sorting domain-containing protein n=1 Tax=Alkalitalea saponilacus TaxID=889453 RepID=A0A1T5EX03_9BACT|nr:cellulase family glycosylhydrolase [Alkalitalea saponilacus]ASB47982.1 glycoside hydrolase [Alkalitalea saponilacus]SKB88504.1 Por secretion system C-terminal sorting domain-containing protein [Alkalitalea saponilacus]
MKQKLLLLIICTSLSLAVFSQTRQPAFEMNERLGRGMNMGNTFEAPSETAWSNPWQPQYFEMMADLGFNHVRIPIRWETEARSMDEYPYTITASFMERIQEVVDNAIENGLIAIINMHHHELLLANPSEQYDRFIAQWVQIAEFFKDYPDEYLLFEVLNEPHQAITPQMWNDMFADALEVIRETNPTRVVLMGTAEFGGLSGVRHIELPEDDYLILSVHYYNPFQFTHQGADWVEGDADEWLGTKWYDTVEERNFIINEFNYTIQFSNDNDVPIHVGEFGVYSRADMESRARWTTFVARWFEEQGFSWAYWEFSSSFGIYNRNTGNYRTELVDALLNNSMPEPASLNSHIIYESDFTEGEDGWAFQLGGEAAGTMSVENNQLEIEITNGSSLGWHAQLFRPNISLENGKLYRFSFSASASFSGNSTVYMGRNAPDWDAYSDHHGVQFTSELQHYSYSFTMNADSDPEARMAFDLGGNTGLFVLRDVKVEEVLLPSSTNEMAASLQSVYPNPVMDRLYVRSNQIISRIKVYSISGVQHFSSDFNSYETDISFSEFSPGYYLVKVMDANGKFQIHKILK